MLNAFKFDNRLKMKGVKDKRSYCMVGLLRTALAGFVEQSEKELHFYM